MKKDNKKQDPQLHRLDEKYMEMWEPDPNFDPEHNKRVIAETIKETERNRRRKVKEFEGPLRERAWASAKYIKNLEQGKGETDPIKFFGKDYAMYLKGKTIIDRLNDKLQVVNKEGKVIRKADN
jgi:hypothetical protein